MLRLPLLSVLAALACLTAVTATAAVATTAATTDPVATADHLLMVVDADYRDVRAEDWLRAVEVLFIERDYLIVRADAATYAAVQVSMPSFAVIDSDAVAPERYISVLLEGGIAGELGRAEALRIGQLVFERGAHLIVRRQGDPPADLSLAGMRSALPLRALHLADRGEPSSLPAANVVFDQVVADIVSVVSESDIQDTILNLENFVTRNARTTAYEEACGVVHDVFEFYGIPAEIQEFWAVPWYGSSFPCWNVIAEKPGTYDPSKVFIICGHLDSTAGNPSSPEPAAPGADDNASGSAAVLEAARICSFFDFKYTIRFICFGAEEQGLCGSSVYAQNMALAGEEIHGVINLDMVLYAPEFLDQMRISYDSQSESLAQAFGIAASTYVPALDVDVYYNPGAHYSDHYPFWVHGYEALQGSEEGISFNPHYHSTTDVLANYMQYFPFGTDCIRAAIATLAMLAQPSASIGVADAGAPAALDGLRITRLSPNPARGSTLVTLESPTAERVSVALYDVLGRSVWRDVVRVLPGAGSAGGGGGNDAGAAAGGGIRVDVAGLPNGVYVLRAEADGGSAAVRKLVVAR
jgi:hypothetical protein